jgi:Zn-dependent protease with chaperone function
MTEPTQTQTPAPTPTPTPTPAQAQAPAQTRRDLLGNRSELSITGSPETTPPQAARPPGSLWWMYVMVTLALFGIGSGAGQVAALLRNGQGMMQARNCLVNHGIQVDRIDFTSAVPGAYLRCLAPSDRYEATGMLIGAVLVPLTAWLLMVGAGLWIRLRLRDGGMPYTDRALEAAAARFEYWCDVNDLRGRRRPQLLLGRPQRRTMQAYTTAVPFRRPLVVIPAGYAYLDVTQFDIVVLHELAHVRSRDLTWASAVWWAGWLNVPVLTIAFIPLFTTPRLIIGGYRNAMLVALAMSLITLVLRVAVLRRREQLADHHAVSIRHGADTLQTATASARARDAEASRPGLRARLITGLRDRLSSHPPAGTRAQLAARVDDDWQSGPMLALAAGLLAMFTYQALNTILLDVAGYTWPDPRLPSDISLLTAILLWALIVVPAWARSSAPVLALASGRTRWSTLAGSAAGLTAGDFIRSPGSLTSTGAVAFAGHLGLAVAVFAGAALGGSLVAAGLAGMTSGAREGSFYRSRVATVAAVIGATAVTASALDTCVTVLIEHLRWSSPALVREMLTQQGDFWWNAWSPLVLVLSAVVLASSTSRPGPRGIRLFPRAIRPVIAVATVTSAAIGILAAQLRPAAITLDARYTLMTERCWAFAVAGWIVVATGLLLSRSTSRSDPRRVGFAQALLAGAVTTGLAGLAQFGNDAVTRSYQHPGWHLVAFLQTPLWLLGVLLVVGLPTLILLRDAAAGRPRALVRIPSARTVPILVAVTVAALTSAVVTGAVGMVTIRPGDLLQGQAASRAEQARENATAAGLNPLKPAAAGTPTTALDPGRVLSPAQATAILHRLQGSLPQQWRLGPTSTAKDTKIRPASCASLFAAVDAADKASHARADVKRTYTLGKDRMPPFGASLEVNLSSYPKVSSAGAVLASAWKEAEQCPRWSVALPQATDGRMRLTITADAPATVGPSAQPVQMFRVTGKWKTRNTSFQLNWAEGFMVVGHTVVAVETWYASFGSPPADVLARLHSFRKAVLASALEELGQVPGVRRR